MGVTCNQYMIFNSLEPKLLNQLRKFALKKFSKDSELEHYADCIANVGGGMNSHYSFVIYPTGFNGGWGRHRETIDSIIDKMYKINYREYEKAKKDNDIPYSISLMTLSDTDWGYTFGIEDLESGQNPTLKWENQAPFLTYKEDNSLKLYEKIKKYIQMMGVDSPALILYPYQFELVVKEYCYEYFNKEEVQSKINQIMENGYFDLGYGFLNNVRIELKKFPK